MIFLDVNNTGIVAEPELHTVMVTGAPYSSLSQARTKMKSKIAMPLDVCEGEKVTFIQKCQSEFQAGFSKALDSVTDEKQVLIIVLDNTNTLIDLVKQGLSGQEYLDHLSWSPCDEKEVASWIEGTSDVKFVITDEWTVAGFEFDTVILIGYSHEMSLSQGSQGSLSQRYVWSTKKILTVVCIFVGMKSFPRF